MSTVQIFDAERNDTDGYARTGSTNDPNAGNEFSVPPYPAKRNFEDDASFEAALDGWIAELDNRCRDGAWVRWYHREMHSRPKRQPTPPQPTIEPWDLRTKHRLRETPTELSRDEQDAALAAVARLLLAATRSSGTRFSNSLFELFAAILDRLYECPEAASAVGDVVVAVLLDRLRHDPAVAAAVAIALKASTPKSAAA